MKSKQVIYDCTTGQTRIEEVETEEIAEDLPIVQESSLEERIISLEKKNQLQNAEIALNQEVINFMLFQSTSMMLSEQTKGINPVSTYLANQILKGRLDYTLVVSQYGKFKEDIDEFLMSKEMMLSQENAS